MKIREFKYFWPERPVLVVRDQPLVQELSDNELYIGEPKYNGQNCMLHVLDGKVQFWTRHGTPMAYDKNPDPEMVEFIKDTFRGGYYQFNGELRHNKVIGVQHKIVLWEPYIWKDEFLYKTPYWGRRGLLEANLPIDDTLKVSLIRQYKTDFTKVFDDLTAEENEFEGLVIKNLQGKLRPGRKSCPNSSWMYKIRKQTGRHRY